MQGLQSSKPLPKFRQTINLIPFSGIQFLDFGFNVDALPKISRAFWEEERTSADGETEVDFRCLKPDPETGALIDPTTGRAAHPNELYQLNTAKGMETFLGKWVPLPFFRVCSRDAYGNALYERGPANWARARLLPEADKFNNTHRLVVAFDTVIEPLEEGRPYLVPSTRDSEEEQEFEFVADDRHNGWFLNEGWIDEWLDELLREFKQAQRPGRELRDQDFPYACEHWARYLTFLAVLQQAVRIPVVKLTDTVSEEPNYTPVQVDLALDIGNSRTCGFMIEDYPDDRLDLNNSYVLELRDLSHPERIYAEPFDSRVEFAKAGFGKDYYSRRGGRPNAFAWHSVVRTGPEAVELCMRAEGIEGATGLSSPKRYIWDRRPLNQLWRFNSSLNAEGGLEPPVRGPFMAFVTETGEVIRQLSKGERARSTSALRAKFSRCSLFTLMLHEILLQALVQINSPANRGQRKYSEVPRRLRRIILTIPPGMPIAERKILVERANGAVKLAWDCLGWHKVQHRMAQETRVEIVCDEASCTQLVYLYSETSKLLGAGEDLFRLLGKPRQGYGSAPSLRLASIDIGGGTTDLMVTTFEVEDNRALNPTENFRESFKIAGDDVLRAVIWRHLIPAIAAQLSACGVREPRVLVSSLFGANRANMAEQERHLRKQFVAEIAVPIGLALIRACEQASMFYDEPARTQPLSGFFTSGLAPSKRLVDYLEQAAAAAGGGGFQLADVNVPVNVEQVAKTVRSVLAPILSDLCEVVHELDCDVLLLSGRLSRLPAVQQVILAKMAVAPNRVVPMHRYRVGSWYPFRNHLGRIEDPKTSTAVGAMLCALAEGQMQNFLIRTRLQQKSTARFIGTLEESGQLKRSKEIFSDIDLDRLASGEEQAKELKMFTNTLLGYRQLPLERWPAMPLYHLDFADLNSLKRQPLPLYVMLKRTGGEGDDAEYSKEDFQIDAVEAVEDGQRVQLSRHAVAIRLQTLKDEDGYWLDTGALEE